MNFTQIQKDPRYFCLKPIRFIFNQKDLDLFYQYKDTALVKLQSEVIQLEDHEITDSSSRYGFFIVSSEQYDEIKDVLPV